MAIDSTVNVGGQQVAVNAPGVTQWSTPPPIAPIPVNQTSGQTPLNVGATIPPVIDNASSVVAGASQSVKSTQDYIDQATAPKTPEQSAADALTSDLSGLIGKDTGKAGALATEEANQNVPGLTKDLNNINSEIQIKTAEYDKQYADAEKNAAGATTFAVTGYQAAIRKSQAADIGLLSARAQALQGNISLAKDTAAKAVDLKYASVEDQIKTKQAQLQLLQPTLNKQEQTQATALSRQYADQQARIAEEKQKVKDNLNLAMQAQVKTQFINNNGRFFDAKSGTTFAKPEDFFKAAGVTSFAEAYQKGLVTDVNGSTMSDQNLAAQAQAKYTDVSIPANATRDQIAQIIKGSRIYQKETYIAPNAYTNPNSRNPNNSGSTIDLSKYKDANSPQNDLGGLSANGLTQSAKLFLANGGKMPALGLGSAPATQAKRNAIINYAGQLADSMGLDINQISALYKANSKAAGAIIDRVARIDTTSTTLVSQFPRLAQLAQNVGKLGISESDITAGKAAALRKFGSTDAANYIELIQTIRGDYAALQSSLAGSRSGQFFGENAKDAIPLGLTPEQYQGLANTIKMSAINAKNATSTEASKIISDYASTGGDTNNAVQLQDPKTGEIRSFQGLSPQDIQDALNKGYKKVQ